MTNTEKEIITGQVEALLPQLEAATQRLNEAKEEVDGIKAYLQELIQEPQTIRTAWGSVTLNRGRRTVTIVDRALKAQITMLKEQGIASGKCTETRGQNYITYNKN